MTEPLTDEQLDRLRAFASGESHDHPGEWMHNYARWLATLDAERKAREEAEAHLAAANTLGAQVLAERDTLWDAAREVTQAGSPRDVDELCEQLRTLRAEVERLRFLADSYDWMVEQCHAAASERDAALDRATQAGAKLERVRVYADGDMPNMNSTANRAGFGWGVCAGSVMRILDDDTPTGGSDGE